MAISNKLYDSYFQEYDSVSKNLTKVTTRIPLVFSAVSSLPLLTDLGTQSSRFWLALGLAVSGVTVLLEVIRQHLNLKHIEIILTNQAQYDDFYFKNTPYGSIADQLFWVRGLFIVFSGGLIIYGLFLFRLGNN